MVLIRKEYLNHASTHSSTDSPESADTTFSAHPRGCHLPYWRCLALCFAVPGYLPTLLPRLAPCLSAEAPGFAPYSYRTTVRSCGTARVHYRARIAAPCWLSTYPRHHRAGRPGQRPL